MDITQSLDERRKSKRFNLSLQLEYTTLTQSPIQGSAIAKNIGRGGVAFQRDLNLQTGNTIQLKLNVPGEHTPVVVTGRIAWTDETDTGVSLTKISKMDQERILEFIYQTWLEKQK